jgi:hypothetical protein
MQQYVCVRIPRMDDVNIALFEYDRYNTLYFFVMNADEQIYMRYGGRDAESPDTYLNLESIELALTKGLDLHEQYKRGELKPKPLPTPRYPREIPLLVERTFARNNCVECHLIGDFQNQHRELDGTLDKPTHMFRSPDIKMLGIFLDVPKGLIVKEAKGAVEKAGLKAGDRVAALNGTTVWTFGDLQYAYDMVPRKSARIELTVDRGGQMLKLPVDLPPVWWWSDVRYKQLSIDPRVYFESREMTGAEKKQRNLDPEGFASMVTYVSSLAATLKSHELKVGDVVVGVDGAQRDEYARTADGFIRLRKKAGDPVKLDVLREGKRFEMPLTTYKMSFRK